ncbi:pilus assembly protein TadE [Massilia cavernae]|uniref:Pilus assembly protein TadE n=2 Tax=Massilia cavernae TaxID=2320864 RepID=A0A418XGL1_9BURK|nr:pilus assembly protein TadE [Massilia cavernae]
MVSRTTSVAQAEGEANAVPQARHPERGAVAIMFALTLILVLGVIGIAIDTARLYNRKAELQHFANAVALAAANELNGAPSGVANALAKASSVAEAFMYQYNSEPITWTDAAISFSSTPELNGGWLDAGAAGASPNTLLFVKVDTSRLDPVFGSISTAFMHILSGSETRTVVGGRAIAGRSAIRITPLAVCALSGESGATRTSPGTPPILELVEYGFRRGVSYDLMQLNPDATVAENFVVSSIDPPGVAGAFVHTTVTQVEPFICSGTLSIPRVTGGAVTVARPFPIASLYKALNSRFDQYAGTLCTPDGAPPDFNIKSYTRTSIPWMATVPAGQTAAQHSADGKLRTIADPSPAPASNTAPMYGPLWVYAKAVPVSSYTPGAVEPPNGYTPFTTAAWAKLYAPGAPVTKASYPVTKTPYWSSGGANFESPSVANRPGVRDRRVLNIPLLSCPVPAGTGVNVTATVLAIGKFFMTVPATPTTLSAEFAGVVPEQSLGGSVELY